MISEWLTEKCATTDPLELRLQDMASLGLSEADRQKWLESNERFERWIDLRWNPFIAEMIPGDELWRFRSPSLTWANMAGRAGYAIVRNGEVVRSLVTLMN